MKLSVVTRHRRFTILTGDDAIEPDPAVPVEDRLAHGTAAGADLTPAEGLAYEVEPAERHRGIGFR